MILTDQQQLTELVRLLQTRRFVFAADPQPITEALRHDDSDKESRLLKRAAFIDRDGALNQRLQRIQQYTRWLLSGISLLCLIGGFSASMALLAGSELNFFYVLLSALGVNTLTLLLWLILLLLPVHRNGFVFNPALWLRLRDPVGQAIAALYAEQAQTTAARWFAGMTSHRFWLCTLSGMWLALCVLLLVRQYGFNWESTLLSDVSLLHLVAALSWLPEKLSFPVPDAEAVLHSRSIANTAAARAWGGLLLAAVFCYGILPRAAAWLFCWLMWRQQRAHLPLNLPYYQNIIQQWQHTVVDADTVPSVAAITAPLLHLNDAPKWAVLLDTSWHDKDWYLHTLGQDWINLGKLDKRGDTANLASRLQTEPAQLLLGIRAEVVPDRGILRQINILAQAAQGGILVQLLADKPRDHDKEALKQILNQWQHALIERNIAFLPPPFAAQQTETH